MKVTKLPTLEEIAYPATAKVPTRPSQAVPPRAKGTEQAPSTQKILARSIEEDEAAKMRPISTLGQTTLGSSLEEVQAKVARRDLTSREVAIEEELRHRTDRNDEGQSEESSVNEAKKRVALDAIKK